MKTLYFLLTLTFGILLATTYVEGQGWIRTYGEKETYGSPNVIEALSDGGCLVGGFFLETPGERSSPIIYRMDKRGNILWSKVLWEGGNYEGCYNDLLTRIEKVEENRFLVLGSRCVAENEHAFFAILIDDYGNFIHYNEYGRKDVYNARIHDVLIEEDGFRILGNYEEPNNTEWETYWFKIDKALNLQEELLLGEAYQARRALPAIGGGYILVGPSISDVSPTQIDDLVLTKLNDNNEVEWQNRYKKELWNFVPGDIFYTGSVTDIINWNNSYLIILRNNGYQFVRINSIGQVIEIKTYAQKGSEGIIHLGANKFMMYGSENNFDVAPYTRTVYMIEYDWNLGVQWRKKYPFDLRARSEDVTRLEDGSYIMACLLETNYPYNGVNYFWSNMALIKTDSKGDVYSNHIKGRMYFDINENCEFDVGDVPAKNRKIEISPINWFATTDDEGRYALNVDVGEYVLTPYFQNDIWELSCLSSNEQKIDINQPFTIIENVDFQIQATENCPRLEVDMSAAPQRRCFENLLHFQYQNIGTIYVEEAYLQLFLPENIEIISSPIPFNQNQNSYTFLIGDLDIEEEGLLKIITKTACDAVLGSTVCITAQLLPYEDCREEDVAYDRSIIEVEGSCIDNQTVHFEIRNVGNHMAGESEYRLYENEGLLTAKNFQLNKDENLVVEFPSNGSTFRVEADQRPNYAGNNPTPSAFVEMCGEPPYDLGYVIEVPTDDEASHIDIECWSVMGSYDPNDKLVRPIGVGEEHCISAKDDLEYVIRFQNTGNDTAFTVRITDMISPYLDMQTFESGVSSHPYKLEIYDKNVVEWTFSNILLVDSTTNEADSHGFVKFKIQQKEGNEEGTKLENQASIYFDFNEPIITNTVFHTIDNCFEEKEYQPIHADFFVGNMDERQETVALDWRIQGESVYFEVEYSEDGMNFQTLERFSKSIGLETYNFEHNDLPQYGTFYYRLKIIDYYGRFQTYSHTLEFEIPFIENLQFYPNPMDDYLHLLIDSRVPTDFRVELIDTKGKTVWSQFFTKLHRLKEEIDLSGIRGGVYLLKVNIGERVIYEKVVISK